MILPLVLALTVQSAPASGRAIQEGKKLFDGMCARCHGIDGTGDEGPALNRATLARAASDDALRDVIRDGIPERGMPRVRRLSDGPGETLPRGLSQVPGRGFAEYLPVQIVTSDGRTIRGVRINEDPFTIQLRDTNNQFHSYRKSELKQLEKEFGKSVMPGFRGRVTDTELDDLVAYLSTLRGVK